MGAQEQQSSNFKKEEANEFEVDNVAVIGAGVMGCGVAQCLAACGYKVKLYDSSRSKLESAIKKIRQDYRVFRLVNGDKYKSDHRIELSSTKTLLKRITPIDRLASLGDCQYLIENITENWALKRDLYLALENNCPDICIYAANTSAIPIHRFARITNRPDKVVGIHFMNPVPQKDVVELIPSADTSERTLAITKRLLKRINKTWVQVGDGPGFVSNRILMITVNEAILTLQEGRASAQEIDLIFKGCFSHAMGPLETGDLIGLDTIRDTLLVLLDEYHEEKYRPAKLLEEMVKSGKLGRKTNIGFYDYHANI